MRRNVNVAFVNMAFGSTALYLHLRLLTMVMMLQFQCRTHLLIRTHCYGLYTQGDASGPPAAR